MNAPHVYRCPKCGGNLRRLARRGSRKKNYQHFHCDKCNLPILAEYDPKDLRA